MSLLVLVDFLRFPVAVEFALENRCTGNGISDRGRAGPPGTAPRFDCVLSGRVTALPENGESKRDVDRFSNHKLPWAGCHFPLARSFSHRYFGVAPAVSMMPGRFASGVYYAESTSKEPQDSRLASVDIGIAASTA